MVYDGAACYWYIDGNLSGDLTPFSGNIGNSATYPFLIASSSNSNYFNGNIFDVRIYYRALSTSELQSLYNSQNVVTQWQLDGLNQNPILQSADTLVSSPIIMNTYHTVNFVSASVEPVKPMQPMTNYLIFSIIGSGIITVVIGFVLFFLLRRSLPLQAKIKGYFRINWGAPFIVGFMLLLVVAIISLSLNWSSFANAVASYAFYVLVVGVVLQLVSFLKYRKSVVEND